MLNTQTNFAQEMESTALNVSRRNFFYSVFFLNVSISYLSYFSLVRKRILICWFSGKNLKTVGQIDQSDR